MRGVDPTLPERCQALCREILKPRHDRRKLLTIRSAPIAMLQQGFDSVPGPEPGLVQELGKCLAQPFGVSLSSSIIHSWNLEGNRLLWPLQST